MKTVPRGAVLEITALVRLRVGAATDRGRVRVLNEDAYALRATQGLFVVCDGMGGAPAGEVASQIAADTIVRQLADDLGKPARATNGDCRYLPETSRLAQAVRFSNQVIYQQGRENPRQARMGTTVVGAWINDHIASVAHVGDSRAYLWHDGHLQAITRDHSLGEALVRDEVADVDDCIATTQRNMLVRVLGGEPEVDVDLAEVPLQPGDYLLLCSDGLTRMVAEWMLREVISRLRVPQRICDRLVEAANRYGGADNITVVVIEVRDGWWHRLSSHWRQP